MTTYEILSLSLEALVVLILLVEYFYGRPDISIKNEEKQRKRLKKKPPFEGDQLCIGEMK